MWPCMRPRQSIRLCETRFVEPFPSGPHAKHVPVIITELSMQGSCQVYSKNDLWVWEGIQITGIKQRMQTRELVSPSHSAACCSGFT
jgi:hypothetical protein